MSEFQQGDRVVAQSNIEASAKLHALIAYCLMVLGLFTGFFWLAGAIWAMVKRSDAASTIYVDHYTNMIKIFWWGLGLSIIGGILVYFVIGWFILLAVWLWSVVKLVKGLARITSNRPYNS